jgi:hypothetical protein
MSEPAVLQFGVKHAGMKLKISLDAKWQTKPLMQSVVVPFVKSFNKKRDEKISEDGLFGMLADETTWIDPTQPANKLPVDVALVELYFGSKDALINRQCRVSHQEIALRIDIETKWLRQPFAQAVVLPFTKAYNKQLVPEPLDVKEFTRADVDGEPIDAADACKPTCLLVPQGAKRIELFFGGSPAASAAAYDAGSSSQMPMTAQRLKAFWAKVRTSEEKLAALNEAKWTNMSLSASDGMPMAAALQAAAKVRCEGSYGDGLGNLLTLNLDGNDLRCEGVIALAPALRSTVCPSLRALYLMNNRIANAGVAALVQAGTTRELKILSLQDNAIGADGMTTLARAIEDKSFYVRHLNVLDNKCQFTGEMEELKKAVQAKYIELKVRASICCRSTRVRLATILDFLGRVNSQAPSLPSASEAMSSRTR